MENEIQQNRLFGNPSYSTYSKIESNKSMIPGLKVSEIPVKIKFYQIGKFIKSCTHRQK
jgi:hypothetical protein